VTKGTKISRLGRKEKNSESAYRGDQSGLSSNSWPRPPSRVSPGQVNSTVYGAGRRLSNDVIGRYLVWASSGSGRTSTSYAVTFSTPESDEGGRLKQAAARPDVSGLPNSRGRRGHPSIDLQVDGLRTRTSQLVRSTNRRTDGASPNSRTEEAFKLFGWGGGTGDPQAF